MPTPTYKLRNEVEKIIGGRLGYTVSDASANLATTTDSAQDIEGCSQVLDAGTYLVWGVFDCINNTANNDRLLVGECFVGGTAEDRNMTCRTSEANQRSSLTYMWIVALSEQATVKLAAKHMGGSTGTYKIESDNTRLITLRIA